MDKDEMKRTYDREAKELLSQKKFMKPILRKLLPGYYKLSESEIQSLLPSKGEQIHLDHQETLNLKFKDTTVDLIFTLEKSVYCDYPGTIVNVEMQKEISNLRDFKARSAYYLSRIFAEQNLPYSELESVISIWLVLDNTQIYSEKFWSLATDLAEDIVSTDDPKLTNPERSVSLETVAKNSDYASPLTLIIIRVGAKSNPAPGTLGEYLKDLFFKKYRDDEEEIQVFKKYDINLTKKELKMVQQTNSLADLFEEIGEERNQTKIENQVNKALQADPKMSLAEFKEKFLKKQKND